MATPLTGSKIVDVKGKKYHPWSWKNDRIRGVGTVVKVDLSIKVVEVLRKSDGVMAMALVFEEEVMKVQ